MRRELDHILKKMDTKFVYYLNDICTMHYVQKHYSLSKFYALLCVY